MNKYIIIVGLLIIPFLWFKCSSTKETTKSKNKVTENNLQEKKNIPVGGCSILAKFVDYETSISKSPKKLCDSLPCNASIEILEVYGYGSSFSGTFQKGKKIQCNFTYSIKPYRSENIELPGLKIGDQLKAIVYSSIEIGRKEPVYTINGYQFIK